VKGSKGRKWRTERCEWKEVRKEVKGRDGKKGEGSEVKCSEGRKERRKQ
jgi:hypothetical protein